MKLKVPKRIVDDFNIRKQAQNLGVSIWQTPSLMFIMMGMVSIISMLALYYLLKESRSTEALVITEALTVSIIFTLGSVVIRNFEVMAQANKIKTEFVSVASHQLKTPLSKVGWGTELLLSKYGEGLTVDQKRIIERIVVANEEMERLVKDLLDVARIDQGNLFLANEKIDLGELVTSIANANKDLAKNFGARLNVVIDKDLPFVTGDNRRMSIVIDNLISNAIKYTTGDGYVEVSVKKDDRNIVCCVKDNGVGIPEDQQSNIFEKFFRSDNAAKLRTSGTGLGLYIAKNTIDQSGGKMWFKSIEEVGSLFCFSLPVNKRL